MLSTALYLLTSHIAWLDAPRDASGNPAASGSPPPPIVGRISNASEGSVSVATDVGGDGNASFPGDWWYKQTRWGAEYVAMTAAVRTAHYVPSPRLPFVPNGYFTGRRGFY
jgi:hypothetical protein